MGIDDGRDRIRRVVKAVDELESQRDDSAMPSKMNGYTWVSRTTDKSSAR